ncbi:hypothetical protein COCNU_scaffold004537G000010 [Cocos nucifera]|nr:hypothetical protein [Cocos nucifera]
MNQSVKITIMLAGLRMEPVVEMTLSASPIEVPMKVTVTKMEGTTGTFGPEALVGFAEVSKMIPTIGHPPAEAQDAEMVLVNSAKENSHLLGVNEALTLEMEALKAWLVEAKVFEEGA